MSAPRAKRRIAICEDSRAFASGLKSFLERDPGLEVAGVCTSAEELLAAIDGLDPDLVTMDLEMPGMGGIAGIEALMKRHPVPILVLSAHAGKNTEAAARALAAGALEAMPKSGIRLESADDVWATAVRSKVKRLATVRLDRRATGGPVPAAPAAGGGETPRSAKVIAIGASTGGPPALASVLGGLPADFEVPIVVVQHMPPGFVEGLVSWLDGEISLPVALAREGAKLERGVRFAPDGAHLCVRAGSTLALDSSPYSGLHRPSVDALFRSLAESVARDALGVVLTGMGRDGADGTRAIVAAGGHVIAQDERTSAVFGMPRGAIESGAGTVLPLERIAASLARIRRPSRAR